MTFVGGPGRQTLGAGAAASLGAAPSHRARVNRIASALLARAVAHLVVAAVLLAIGGALLVRVRGGAVTPPVAVAPGIVGERGSGAWLYAVRHRDGVALVDAGRDAKGRPIDAALAPLGLTRAAVTDVLLTHGHPSETSGLAAVRSARVHAGAADVQVITGRERPGDGFDKVLGLVLPTSPAPVADAIPGEKVIELGGERVLALPVPGHTLGSTAYLVRGVLFVGDAASLREGRLVPGPSFLSHDPARAEIAVVRLARRVAGEPVSVICTGHAGCSDPGSAAAALAEAASREESARR
jgi:glyoxylase-like metal-dependent hydrolase (beta-lactamase superfamily II)